MKISCLLLLISLTLQVKGRPQNEEVVVSTTESSVKTLKNGDSNGIQINTDINVLKTGIASAKISNSYFSVQIRVFSFTRQGKIFIKEGPQKALRV